MKIVQSNFFYFIIPLFILPNFIFAQSPNMRQQGSNQYFGQQLNNQSNFQTINPITDLPRQAIIMPYVAVEEEPSGTLTHFGYDFLTRRDTVAFWENLPTPANYLLGPGDELVISLWGETQLRETFTITRDGKIYDTKVGLLNLTGKSMEEAKSYLKAQFARVYATLKGRNPSTFIDVS